MAGPRERLVARLRSAGVIGDPAIARAFRAVPRHRFVPEVSVDRAYSDEVVPTKLNEHGRPISSASQPSMVALMLRQLALRPGHRVLEIGAGTGYNAALLAELVGEHGRVTTVDLDPDTVERAAGALAENGYWAVRVRRGDGGHGFEPDAPYDRIVVTAGAADLPPAWWRQLVVDGLLVVPLALSGIDVSIAFRKLAGATPADERLVSRSQVGCGFMPMRGAFAGRGAVLELAGPGVRAVFEDARTSTAAGSDASAGYLPDLRSAIDNPAPRRSTGVTATVGELLRGLEVWLATTDPAFCRIELDADVSRTDVVVSPLLASNGEGRSVALAEPDGVAVVDHVPAAQSGAGAGSGVRIDDPETGVELGVRGFGPRGPDLCDRLAEAVREWDRRGRPGPERMRVFAVPTEVPLPERRPIPATEDVRVVEKPHCRLMIRWR